MLSNNKSRHLHEVKTFAWGKDRGKSGFVLHTFILTTFHYQLPLVVSHLSVTTSTVQMNMDTFYIKENTTFGGKKIPIKW